MYCRTLKASKPRGVPARFSKESASRLSKGMSRTSCSNSAQSARPGKAWACSCQSDLLRPAAKQSQKQAPVVDAAYCPRSKTEKPPQPKCSPALRMYSARMLSPASAGIMASYTFLRVCRRNLERLGEASPPFSRHARALGKENPLLSKAALVMRCSLKPRLCKTSAHQFCSVSGSPRMSDLVAVPAFRQNSTQFSR